MAGQIFYRVVTAIFMVMLAVTALPVVADNNNTKTPHQAEVLKTVKIGLPILREQRSKLSQIREFLESYWQHWSDKQGLQSQFFYLSQGEVYSALKSGKIDIMGFGFHNPDYAHDYAVSIPLLTFHPMVYKHREGIVDIDQHTNDSILIHLPSTAEKLELFGLNDNRNVLYTTNVRSTLKRQKHVSYIYSWAPWVTEQTLKESDQENLYSRLEQAAPLLHLRAIVPKHNKQLLLQINEGIRDTSTEKTSMLWSASVGEELPSVEINIGAYSRHFTAQQNQYIVNNPVVEIGFIDDNFGPYHYRQLFNTVGFTQDILNNIFRSTGLTFNPRLFDTYKGAVDALSDGKLTMLPNQTVNSVYSSNVATTQPYHTSPITVALKTQTDLEVLKNKKVIQVATVGAAAVNENLFALFPNAIQKSFSDTSSALLALEENKVNAFLGNGPNIAYLIAYLSLQDLRTYDINSLTSQQTFAFGVSRSQPELLELLNLGIASISHDDKQKIHRDWIENGYAESDDNRNELTNQILGTLLELLTTGLIVILLALFVRQKYLHHELQKQLKRQAKKRQEAEDAAHAKSDFLARMSHEIRTPMNGVMGMAEALSFSALDAQQKDLLDTLNSSALNLMALLNDVLDFSKMDAGKLTVESIPMNLSEVMKTVIDNFRHKATSRGLSLSWQADPALAEAHIGDPVRLTQTLNNLVSNSIKFTESGFVRLSATLLQNDDEDQHNQQIKIDVRDSGIGIAENKIDALFNPFVQADGDTTRRFGGTGLGLSICKEIVETLGGTIEVSSLEGIGSLFSITLTLPAVTEYQNVNIDHNAPSLGTDSDEDILSRLNVLLAEDNKVNRKVIIGQLNQLGIKPHVAENGLIAYQMLQQEEYDIVLSDCHMPEMDGLELASKISQQRSASSPRLIAITADALSGASEKCLEAGFDNYMAKPCPLNILRAKLLEESQKLNHEPVLSPITEVAIPAENEFEPELELVEEPFGYLNYEAVLELSGGDEEICSQILSAFLETCDHDITLLQLAASTADFVTTKDMAHKIKGSVRYLGATSLAEQAEFIESAAQRQQNKALFSAVVSLTDGFEQLRHEVSTRLNNTTSDITGEIA